MNLVNYLGTFETFDQVWETYSEGGKEGDYLYVANTLKRWDKYSRNWIDPTEEDLSESVIHKQEQDVVVGSSSLINYLGRFSDVKSVHAAYPYGGNEGDYLYIGDDIYAWDKYQYEWVEKNDIHVEVSTSNEEVITNSSKYVNYLGGFVDSDSVWRKYPQGGKDGDYVYIAEELHIWDKYKNNWIAALPPDESSQMRPIEVLQQDGVVSYSDNYINYLGEFDTVEQAWEVYPEGGKDGDFILVGGEQLRWNKYISDWGEDTGESTPARPVATVWGDLHVHNDLVVGEDIIAAIFDKYAPKWMLSRLTPIRVETEEMMQAMIDNGTVKEGQIYYVPEEQ